MVRLEMKNYSMILMERKFKKYEYLTGGDVLPSNQQQIIEQAIFIHSPLGKAFEKQLKQFKIKGKNRSRL